MATKKQKAPTDATLRNVRASKKRDKDQDAKFKALERRVSKIEKVLIVRLGIDVT